MNGKAELIAAGGAGLILANFWTSSQRSDVVGGIFGSGSSTKAHQQLVKIGGEILFVGAAVILANYSDHWGTAMAVVLVALFILWAMHQTGSLGNGLPALWTQRAAGSPNNQPGQQQP